MMIFLQRLVISVVVAVVFALLLHLGVTALSGAAPPPGLSGIVGGVVAVLVWAGLKRRAGERFGKPR